MYYHRYYKSIPESNIHYYGEIIDNMPILEAMADERQMMKYKLVTFAKNLVKIPQVQVSEATTITLNAGDTYTITPNVPNFENANSTLGYTATLASAPWDF